MSTNMKEARNSFGKPHQCKFEWPEDCFVQCGESGLVLDKKGSYTTAFFEAFPKSPSCFLRGEGASIEEAEENCWNRYQRVISCDHEMERRDRTDGYGYCKHCSYSSMVFEPLTKCCKCGTPTNKNVDYKGNHYCGKHKANRLRNPNPPRFFDDNKKRTPRKYKKRLVKAAKIRFNSDGIFGKLKFQTTLLSNKRITCGNKVLNLLFKAQERRLLGLPVTKYEDFD
jgi:hypothetical protein